MKYKDFKKKLSKYPYFTSAIYGTLASSPQLIHNQVNSWVKNGEVVKLKRGLYTLNDEDRKVGLSKGFLANLLYSPSYISLEFALAYYDLIPEAVYSVTSLTTKKTQEFSNMYGRFYYRNIKKTAFTGFVSEKDEFGFDFLIALPEKAIVDYLYYNVSARLKLEDSYFLESMRLQNYENLNISRLREFAAKMDSRKMTGIIEALCSFVKEE